MKRALLLTALLLPACSNSRTQSPESATATPAADQWVPAKPTARLGDIQVTVAQADVESLPGSGSRDQGFAIRLSLDNTNPTTRRLYRTWQEDAILVDNFGNDYKRLSRSRGVGVFEAPLNPAAPVTDVLLFEAPIATAGYVDLHLPGANIGARSGLDFRLNLQTSGARLETVKQAAAAHEAEANARAAAIAAREAAAKRAEEAAKRRAEQERLAAVEARRQAEEKRRQDELVAEQVRQEAEAKRRQDELAAEKDRLEAQRKKEEADREAELQALPGKLASARRALELAESKMKKIKAATSRYVYSGQLPDDFFDSKGRYIYFDPVQKVNRRGAIQAEIEELTTEIAGLEARLKTIKKAP